MITGKDAFSDELVISTESALGALGKMIYFQKENTLITDDVVKSFLSKLPLEHEEEEA